MSPVEQTDIWRGGARSHSSPVPQAQRCMYDYAKTHCQRAPFLSHGAHRSRDPRQARPAGH
eukprot:3024040-Pyramimonas_sp.AAC.1